MIADSIETVAGAEGFDGLVAIGGCDKNMPGCLMAIGRLNRPPSSSTAARSCPASWTARTSTSSACSRRSEAITTGGSATEELHEIECSACPGPGLLRRHVHGQHHGLRHRSAGHEPARFSSSTAAISPGKRTECRRSRRGGAAAAGAGHPAARHHDAQAFENAITVVIALGGSTNAFLHLLAIAHAARWS